MKTCHSHLREVPGADSLSWSLLNTCSSLFFEGNLACGWAGPGLPHSAQCRPPLFGGSDPLNHNPCLTSFPPVPIHLCSEGANGHSLLVSFPLKNILSQFYVSTLTLLIEIASPKHVHKWINKGMPFCLCIFFHGFIAVKFMFSSPLEHSFWNPSLSIHKIGWP